MDKPIRSAYTPTDFAQWKEGGALSLTPKFQRRGVWKTAARSFFIDTLLREMPVPPIYIRVTQSKARDRIIREVVDGQQRIAAVLEFMDNHYRLSKNLKAEWSGKRFEQLTDKQQDRITGYAFSAEVFQGISDLEVLELFSRLNTYSVPLNSQELRNGRYFGFFKQTAYALGHEHLEFWRAHHAFSERNIARMLEVEFVSEVLIAQLAGMQDKKKTIDDFYAQFDDQFPGQSQAERRFRVVTDEINESFSDGLGDTEFSRSPLLYTLFCVIGHRCFGIPNVTESTPRRALRKDERSDLKDAVLQLTEKIEKGRARQPIPKSYAEFVGACLTQTDNIGPRRIRFKKLYGTSFG